MSKVSFVKTEGAGNDFIIIDDRQPFFPTQDQALIQRLCHRKSGIGADGLILLQKDPVADFRMRIFNSDGSEAESCGNGLRCLVRFIDRAGCKTPVRIATGSGIVEAAISGDKVSVQMGACRDLRLGVLVDGREVHSVNTGVPHVVLFVDDVTKVDVEKLGLFFRRHPHFQPSGTNVNFATLLRDGAVRVRTFERGVEGETLACGTGAVAVGVVAGKVHALPSPVRTVFSGGEMEIHFDAGLADVAMIGPARIVFEGVVEFVC